MARRPGFAGLLAGGPARGSHDSTARVGANTSGSMNLGFEAPADAYAVEAAVDALGDWRVALVRHHAISGSRPDWCETPIIWVENDGPMRGWNERGRSICIGHCVSFHGDLPENVAQKRASYAAWVDCLAALRDSLGDSLAMFVVGEILSPQKPWN